ncbi:MAG: YybH family protein [Acidobacteriota bacterium]
MIQKYSLLIVVLGLTAACSAAAPPAVDAAAEEQAIRAMSAKWLELERAKDAAGVAAQFLDDATVTWAGTGTATGPAAIEALLTKSWSEAPSVVTTWSTDRVHVAASGDMAVEQGTWSSTGGPTGDDHGKYITLYRKVNGAWKVAADTSGSLKAMS